MFLDVKELAVHKLRIRKTYAPGSIDFHSAEIKQIEPLEVTAMAELLEGQIRIDGTLETKIELVCARCLEPVVEEVSRTFDLFYAPLPKDIKHKEDRLKDDDTEIGFYEGPGLFLADGVEGAGAAGVAVKGHLSERLPGAVPELRCKPEPRRVPL